MKNYDDQKDDLNNGLLKGVIFDFNGTLFWDTDLHNKAWDVYLQALNVKLTNKEKDEHIHGRSGKDIFEFLLGEPLTVRKIMELTEAKEAIYRSECEKQDVALAPGAADLLQYLIDEHIPFGIATASCKSNVDYFYEKFQLHKYLTPNAIVFDDGQLRGKPFPDMFLRAMQLLKLKAEHTICFEDSNSGIQAAENAGFGKIIIVNSTGRAEPNSLHSVIINFNDFDRSELVSTVSL